MNVILITASIAAVSISAGDRSGSSFSDVLEFSAPLVMQAAGGGYVVFEGAGLRCVPGEPLRSVVTLLVPVPPGARPSLTCSASDYSPTGLSGDQAAAPLITGDGLAAVELPADPLPPPSEHAVLEGIMPLAGGLFAVISVYPVAGPDGASYASKVEVRLTWEAVPGGIPVERAGLAALFAPEGALFWPSERAARAQSPFWGRPWARLSIGDTGGYKLSGQDLENAGCEVAGVPSGSLRLFTGPGLMFDSDPETEHQLAEAAFTVSDQDDDGLFDVEDEISFIGRGLDRWSLNGSGILERIQHRYAEHNVYWLTWGGESGLRTRQIDGAPGVYPEWGSTILLDAWFREQHVWKPIYESSTGWTWSVLDPNESVQVQCGIQPPAGSGMLRVGVVALGSGSTTASLWLNGTKVLTETWSGSGERQLDAGCTFNETNTLELRYDEATGDRGLALVYAWLEFPSQLQNATATPLFPSIQKTGRYGFTLNGTESGTKIYDITDIDSPKLLVGTEYSGGSLDFSFQVDTGSVMLMLEPGDWMRPDSIQPAAPGRLLGTVTDGDRLIVVDPSMVDDVWPLAALSTEQGHMPVVATTREIYDEFGQGVADPGAIRSTVRWGMDGWATGLQGVMLVGDGHYDMLHHATVTPVMIPVWIALGTSNAACVDDNYVIVHEDAVLPELPISRLPVDDVSELGICNAKILEYASGANSGTWTNRILIVADDEWGEDSWNETDHTQNSERLAEQVCPRYLDREKFYMIEYPWPPGQWTPDGPHPEKPEARQAFIETFSEGFGLMTYIGHGAPGQIAHEKLMLTSDIELLSNGSRLPVSLWGTCDVGRFDTPGADAISEAMVLQPDGGCIASIAGTRGTFGGSNYYFLRAVTDSLYSLPDLPVGEAVWLAKLTESGSYSNNKFYVLFGHNDLPLSRPDSTGTVTIQDDTLRSGELNHLTGASFQSIGLAFVTILESSWEAVYTCLGGAQIEWLKYGGPAFRGTQSLEDGGFSLDCFIPLQANPGGMARTAGIGIDQRGAVCGAADPTLMIEGDPSGGDLRGPEVEMWVRGYEGVEEPEVTGDVTIEASLSDSSGICILGGSGRSLNLFIDGDGTDVGRWFTYDQGSTTTGSFAFSIEDASAGEHEAILWSVDGLGNSARDTLYFRTLESMDLDLTEVVVYPNPGDGQRCFSFRVTEASMVTVTIFTIAGRRIDQVQAVCDQGYNQILWDGLDRDGDLPATGSYIYHLEAVATGLSVFNRTTVETGILAVVRDQGD